MKSRWIIILLLAVVVIGALLWFAPNIISYLQNPTNSSDASYTSLTLRDGINNTATLEFGDTEYSFSYNIPTHIFSIYTFLGGYELYEPHKGDTHRDMGIEVKVSDVASDYVSSYISLLVKPIIQNYSASLHYTKVTVGLGATKSVSISSGLVNMTKQYWFSYTLMTAASANRRQLTIEYASTQQTYFVVVNTTIRDFDMEVRVYKLESGYLVIYVKPLY